MGTNLGGVLNSIVTALGTAAANGDMKAVGTLGSLLHLGSGAGHINYKDKTITVAWEEANQSTAALLLAQGWTIIPD